MLLLRLEEFVSFLAGAVVGLGRITTRVMWNISDISGTLFAHPFRDDIHDLFFPTGIRTS